MSNHLLLLIATTTLTIILFPTTTFSAKILSVTFFTTKSHLIVYEPLLHALAAKGHEVTLLAPYISGKKLPNLREIRTIDMDEVFMKNMPNIFEMKARNEEFDPSLMAKYFGPICSISFDQPHVQAILNEKFDLIFLEAFFNDCLAGAVYKLNTSVILLSPVVAPPMATGLFGNPSPPSFVPSFIGSFDDKMSFFERVVNFIQEGIFRMTWSYVFEPTMEAVYREKLNDSTLPSSAEILRNASLILSNSHLSLSKPRAFLPSIIEVGGMHLQSAKPLPKDVRDFVDNSGSDGFIYFSMGSALNATIMPDSFRKIFTNTFSKLKQKVLWKWEIEHMEDLPKNVKLSKWLPQQDVLGHPKIKMFITHGGFGGTTEAVYHGVPLLGIPMFGDQPINMGKAEKAGYALSLDFATLSEEKLTTAINRILTESKFTDKVKQLSLIFRDQPDKPLDRAVYWTEYVLRHNGATHLRSAARELNFIQFHSIDVILVLLAIFFTIIFIVYKILTFVFRKLCIRNSRKVEYSTNGFAKKQH